MKVDPRVFLPIIGILFAVNSPVCKEKGYWKYQEGCMAVLLLFCFLIWKY